VDRESRTKNWRRAGVSLSTNKLSNAYRQNKPNQRKQLRGIMPYPQLRNATHAKNLPHRRPSLDGMKNEKKRILSCVCVCVCSIAATMAAPSPGASCPWTDSHLKGSACMPTKPGLCRGRKASLVRAWQSLGQKQSQVFHFLPKKDVDSHFKDRGFLCGFCDETWATLKVCLEKARCEINSAPGYLLVGYSVAVNVDRLHLHQLASLCLFYVQKTIILAIVYFLMPNK
jgi:hypothetical protein